MRKGRDLQKGKIRRTYDLVIELWIIGTLEKNLGYALANAFASVSPAAKQSQD